MAMARAFYDHTSAGRATPRKSEGVEFTRWTSGIGTMRREGVVKPGRIRVFVPVGSRTLKEHGADLLAVIDTLLATHEHLEITLSRPRPGNKLMQSRNSRLLRDYPGRFKECCRLSADEQLGQIHEHDWMWIPDTQSENGLPAQQAISCGVPVLAWGIPPFCEIVSHGWTGRLVYCDTTKNWIDAPTARWSTPALISTLNENLAGEEPLLTLQSRDWTIVDREAVFLDFWRRALDA
jgi:glycosyltransferase involved in cell wall biosynthesis